MGLYGQKRRKVRAESRKLPCPLRACILSDSHLGLRSKLLTASELLTWLRKASQTIAGRGCARMGCARVEFRLQPGFALALRKTRLKPELHALTLIVSY